MTSANKVNFQK